MYVSVREAHRAYGGPEEGGWYYEAYVTHHDVTQVVGPVPDELIAKLSSEWDLRPHEHSLPSRWDGRTATDFRISISSTMPQNEERPRPRYE